jgi:excisionase family DNA binding protein
LNVLLSAARFSLLVIRKEPKMSEGGDEKLYSEREAAAKLGVSRVTILRARQAGRIGFYRIGTRVLFSDEHLRAFLASCERKGKAA